MKTSPSRVRSARRRGFSLPLALAGGLLAAMVVTALSLVSQGELRSVKDILDRTTGEFQAYSGLIWVYDKLCREGRWYQPGENSLTDRGKQWKNSFSCVPEGESFPADQLKDQPIRVYLDEVKSHNSKIFPNVTINKDRKPAGLELLDHIKILALGTSGRERTLIYGKLIMMPEPLLNSNQLVGMPEDEPGDPESGEYVVRVPPIRNQSMGHGARVEPGYIWSQDIDLTDRVKIRTVLAAPGQKVRMEDYVVTMNTEWTTGGQTGWATQEPKMRARYDGVVKEVLVKPGDVVNEGDILAVIKKDPVQKEVKFPFIKLVRVTKIPPGVFKGLDLDDTDSRYKIYSYLFEQDREFLDNMDLNLTDSEVQSFFDQLNKKVVEESELGGFPTIDPTTQSALEKLQQSIKNMTYNFVPPMGFDAGKAREFSGSATYELGVQPREITKQLKELLEIHGRKLHNDPDHYLKQLDTLPKKLLREKNKDIYRFVSKKPDSATSEYLTSMVENNLSPATSGDEKIRDKIDTFISSLSDLKDGAAYARIYLNEATPLLPSYWQAAVDSGEITDPENWFTWTNSKGEYGYWKYAPEHAITIKTVDVPYFYTNPTTLESKEQKPNEPGDYQGNQIRVKVSDVLNFHRKFFEEDVPVRPASELRPDDDIEDTPQGPPPPDSTGAIFSGVSS